LIQVQKQVPVATNHHDAASQAANDTALNRLLSLYPDAKPVRIPVRVQLPPRGKGARETTMIAYKTRDSALFSMKFPLCGGEKIMLYHSVESGAAPAVAVALMPDGANWAVAARFVDGTPRWILKS
jgi:hypothetical protein